MFSEMAGMAGLGAILAGLNAGGSALQQAEAYHYAKKLYQHRYRWAVDDMRKAGLNPVLAADGGNVSGMGSVGGGDYGHAVSGGLSSAMSLATAAKDLVSKYYGDDKTRAETEQSKSSTALNKAQTELTNERTAHQAISNGILRQNEAALVKDAYARATNNTALATLNQARADWADTLALNEASRSRLNTASVEEKVRRQSIDNAHRERDFEERLDPEEVKKMKKGAYNREWYKTYILSSINTAGKLFSNLKSMPLFGGGE